VVRCLLPTDELTTPALASPVLSDEIMQPLASAATPKPKDGVEAARALERAPGTSPRRCPTRPESR
jgi:hypothetical protein